MVAWIPWLLITSAWSAVPAQPSVPAFRVIELDPSRATGVYKVKPAPRTGTAIQFPEPWATTPVCGECVLADKEQPTTQLWWMRLESETNTIFITPTRTPDAQNPKDGFITSLNVTLDSGIAVTIFAEVALPEDADARVEFKLPESATSKAKLTKRERELEAKFEERLRAATGEKFLQIVAAGTKCRDFWGGPQRSDHLVVRMRQLCKSGAFVYLVFDVENRFHTDAQIASATLTDVNGAASTQFWISNKTLRFKDRARAAVMLELTDAEQPPSSYTLQVVEDGGENRAVTVENLSF